MDFYYLVARKGAVCVVVWLGSILLLVFFLAVCLEFVVHFLVFTFFFVLEYSRRRLHRLLCRRVRYRGATSLERTPHHLLGNIAPSLVYPSKERGVWERDCTMTDGVNKLVTWHHSKLETKKCKWISSCSDIFQAKKPYALKGKSYLEFFGIRSPISSPLNRFALSFLERRNHRLADDVLSGDLGVIFYSFCFGDYFKFKGGVLRFPVE